MCQNTRVICADQIDQEKTATHHIPDILLHPYVYAEQKPILEFAEQHGIVIEAYSTLIPITRLPGGPVDKPVKKIAQAKGVAAEQVLLAWAKAKGAVVVTMSSKKDRLEKYIEAGDIELSEEDVEAIDKAGARGNMYFWLKGQAEGFAIAIALALVWRGLRWVTGF